jgi:hypothetical protein
MSGDDSPARNGHLFQRDARPEAGSSARTSLHFTTTQQVPGLSVMMYGVRFLMTLDSSPKEQRWPGRHEEFDRPKPSGGHDDSLDAHVDRLHR